MIDLKLFCNTRSDTYTNKPFIFEGLLYAINPYIVVRMPIPTGCEYPVQVSTIGEISAWAYKGTEVPVNDFPDITVVTCDCCRGSKKVIICPECKGEGTLTIDGDFNYYEVTCKTCKGEYGKLPFNYYGDEDLKELKRQGYNIEPAKHCTCCESLGINVEEYTVKLGDFSFKGILICKLKTLPALKFVISEDGVYEGHFLRFTFDGGEGLVVFEKGD